MKTTIQVDDTTRDALMLFKIQSKAKNLDEVMKKAIRLLKREKNVHGVKPTFIDWKKTLKQERK